MILDRVIFGCNPLTSLKSYNLAIELLNIAYEYGIRRFDTAPSYGNGYSEKIIGDFINEKRDVLITTKFGLGKNYNTKIPSSIALPLNYFKKKYFRKKSHGTSISKNFLNDIKIDSRYIELSLKSSLKRLKSEKIECLLFHEGTPDRLTKDAIELLLNYKKNKIINKIGFGTAYDTLSKIKNINHKVFDVVQYDGFKLYNDIIKMEHIFYGLSNQEVLKKNVAKKNISKIEIYGKAMAEVLHRHPKAKIIFSSTKKHHIINNIQSLLKNTNENQSP